MLSFTLLGQTVLSKNGLPLAQFRSQKEAALLIYLAQTGETHPRDFLADLLWESSTTKQSLTNLRTALTRLRKQVGDNTLLITRKTLALAPESQEQVDSVNLLQTLKSIGQIDSAETAVALQQALDTYQGDFLADFHLTDAPQFTEWAMITREYIRRQVITGCQKLQEYALSTGDVEYGIAIARRWLAVDALDETAHTLLIQLLLQADRVQEALAHYDHCVALLQADLGVDPPDKMTALIRDALPKRPALPRPTTEVRHNLPAEYDQFFGRKSAQQEIHIRLDQPWCRLVTITGQGGMGKTRLATTIARSRLSQYRDGTWLVELENIDPNDEDLAEAIAVEIATILDLRLTGSAAPTEQLLNHLQHKQMMLVLDNFEHLVTGRQIILDIVQRCEQVQLIVTSRESLRLRAEWTIALAGLSYPASDTDKMPSDAVELFAARRAQHQRGEISADELAAIRTICRLTAGLPLAIELAAALTHQTAVREVANSLQDGFDALKASLHDVPDKHRGLHVVFEMSWRRLAPALQLRLARLAVFRGGFSAAAATEITDANAQHLEAFIEKSLIMRDAVSVRYTLHPVIRAYAAEKRESTDPTPQKHAYYFLKLLTEHTEPLQKDAPQESLEQIAPDIDNIRRAWQTGLDERLPDLLQEALTSLSIYYQLRGLSHEGEAVMQTTRLTAKAWRDAGIPLLIRASLERARFQNRLGHYRTASKTLEAALKLARQHGDQWAEGMGLVWWGESLWRLGKYDEAQHKLNNALQIAEEIDSIELSGWCHHQLGIIHDIQARYTLSLEHLQTAIDKWRTLNNANLLSVSLNSLGVVYNSMGDLPAAQHSYEQALTICNAINNRHLQSFLLNNLSTITLKQGDYSGAQYYLQLGIELATLTGNRMSQAQIYTNMGRAHFLQGELEQSSAHLEKSLHIAQSMGDQLTTSLALLNLANTKSASGKFEEANSLYDQALQLSQKNNLANVECHIFMRLAQHLRDFDINQARQYSLQAIAIAESIKNPDLVKQAKEINRNLVMAEAENK